MIKVLYGSIFVPKNSLIFLNFINSTIFFTSYWMVCVWQYGSVVTFGSSQIIFGKIISQPENKWWRNCEKVMWTKIGTIGENNSIKLLTIIVTCSNFLYSKDWTSPSYQVGRLKIIAVDLVMNYDCR